MFPHVHDAFGSGPAWGPVHSRPGWKLRIHVIKVRRNIRMSFHSEGRLGRVLATIAVLCAFGALAVAQDQPFPKWELYGGGSFFYPPAPVHGPPPPRLFFPPRPLASKPPRPRARPTPNIN